MRVTRVKTAKNARRAPPPKSPAKPTRTVPLAVSERPAVKKGTPAPKAVAPPPPATLDEQIGFRLRRANQRFTAIFAQHMARFDLAPTQYDVIARLDEMGPMSQSQLERQTCLEQGELLNVVGRLHRRGLLRPRPSPIDPRLIQLELTAEALVILADVKAAAAKACAATLAPLKPDDAKQLKALLARVG